MKITSIPNRIETGLSHYWYSLGYSKKLLKQANKPQRFIVLNTPIVLWRAHEKWFAHKDICPHRQAPLSAGKVINNQLTCPYHGWTFKPCGTLIQIPTLPETEQPKSKACLISYSVYDDGFMIWVCLQQEAKMPQPDATNYLSKKRKTICIEKTFAHNIDDIIENFMDSPHTLYIHQGLIRSSQHVTPRQVDVTMQEQKVLVSHHPSQEEISLLSRFINPSGKGVAHTDTFTLPSHVHVDYYIDSEEPNFSAWISLSPVNENETKLFVSISLNFGWKNYLLAPIVRLLAARVLWQDKHILTLQHKNFSYEPSRNALSTRGDCASNYIRRLRDNANNHNKSEKIEQTIYLNL